ncbi:MAG: FGGY-family carbohydrate kinase [Zavarzinella sp.]
MPILAIDVGTSSVKSAILDVATGEPLAEPQKHGYPIDSPTRDAFQVPADRLREAVWHSAQHAVANFSDPAAIEGIGLSCLMPALVLLDKKDQVLQPIWLHLDRRSRGVAKQVLQDVGDAFLHSCGNRPLPGGMSVLCYAQMLKEHPDLYSDTRWYLHANGWMALLMTGERRFDLANASFTGLFDTMKTRNWSATWCEYFHIEPDRLPPVVCGSTTVGGLLPQVAKEWGLPAGLPVKIGTADTSSAMLSAKMKTGDMLHSVGTTQVLGTLIDNPKPSAKRLTRLFGVGDQYVYVSHNPVGGSALNWIYELCFKDYSKDDFFAKVIFEHLERATTIALDPPYLGGDRLEIDEKYAHFTNLNLATRREDLLAAVLQGIVRGHHNAFAALEVPEEEIHRIILTGGGCDIVARMIPEYHHRQLETIDEGAMRGVARLFDYP